MSVSLITVLNQSHLELSLNHIKSYVWSRDVLMQRSGSKELRVQPSPGGHGVFAHPVSWLRNECACPKSLSQMGTDGIRHLQA